MKNKKGFTLIELLAIIVILAIIAVITVPIILNIIDDATRGAAVDSAYGFKDAIEKYYVQGLASGEDFELADGSYTINSDGTLSQNGETYNINMSGVKPTGGTIAYETGKIKNACLTINGYKVEYIDGKFTNNGKGECEQELTCQYGKATKKYELIDFCQSQDDRREKFLMLTEDGKAYYEEICHDLQNLKEKTIQKMGEEKLGMLRELLEEYHKSIEYEMNEYMEKTGR